MNSPLDAVACPGCGESLPAENEGCGHCGYRACGMADFGDRLPSFSELLTADSYPAKGAAILSDVCPAFLRALVVAALMAASHANSACMWTDDPGANRYTGDPVAAVRSYTDIPAAEREELAIAVAAHTYSAQVDITRDSIGAGRYTQMRDMHWGSGHKCRGAVDRSLWSAGRTERGLIYRVRGYAVIVPSICGNVARITDTQDRPDMHKPATPVPNSTMRRWLAGGSAPRVNQAPEPSTAWLVLAAVACAALTRRTSGA